MKLFLIRHLETSYNRKGVLQGKRDVPILMPDAMTQKKIDANKHILESESPFDYILHSDYQRTRMTANCYGYDQNIKAESLLNELDFGLFEGKPKSDLLSEYTELWKNDPEKIVLGEPLSDLSKRVLNFIEKYKHHQKILIFGHGAWLRALYSIVNDKTIKTMNQHHIENNALLKLQVD